MALSTGRLDGLAFMVGMVVGTGAFASAFESIKGFYLAAEGPAAQTLDKLLGIPTRAVLAILIATAIAGFALGSMFERALGGPLSAEELNGDEHREIVEHHHIEVLKVRAG